MVLDDIGKLAEPFTKLIDVVRDHVEPSLIVKRAKAEATATVVRRQGEIEAAELTLRAERRFKAQQERRQRNLEAITIKAVPELPPATEPKPVDPDWVARFMTAAQDVSDEQMQLLWAKLLAGEVARPGRFSIRTMECVRLLSKADAELFTTFCSYVWRVEGILLAVYPRQRYPGGKGETVGGLYYANLQHLDTVGLIEHVPMGVSVDLSHRGKATSAELQYFNRCFEAQFQGVKEIGGLALTTVGSELFWISGPTFLQDHFDACVAHFATRGLRLTERTQPDPTTS